MPSIHVCILGIGHGGAQSRGTMRLMRTTLYFVQSSRPIGILGILSKQNTGTIHTASGATRSATREAVRMGGAGWSTSMANWKHAGCIGTQRSEWPFVSMYRRTTGGRCMCL